jgi:anti-anti-sigma regulatory factor
MSMSDSQRIPYLVRDGVLKITGQMRYQDRELRLATMMLLSGPQASVCIDLSGVPSLTSPEIQFLAKMAESAKGRGKQLRVRLSKAARDLFKQLELDGLVQIEEVVAPVPKPAPATPGPEAAPPVISLFKKKRYPSNPPLPGGKIPPRT